MKIHFRELIELLDMPLEQTHKYFLSKHTPLKESDDDLSFEQAFLISKISLSISNARTSLLAINESLDALQARHISSMNLENVIEQMSEEKSTPEAMEAGAIMLAVGESISAIDPEHGLSLSEDVRQKLESIKKLSEKNSTIWLEDEEP